MKTDVDGGRYKIACMVAKTMQNDLHRGQRAGDATKAVASGEVERIDDLTPRIETSVESHTVNPNESVRILPNGERMQILLEEKVALPNKEAEKRKISEKDVKVYLARIQEQKEGSMEESEIGE